MSDDKSTSEPDNHPEYKILIGTVSQSGYCHAGYTLSLVKTFSLVANIPNIKLVHKFILNDPLLPRAQNQLAAQLLSDASITHLLLIDREIMWDPRYVLKLLANDKPICGAPCPKKGYRWERIKSRRIKEIVENENISEQEYRNKIRVHLIDYNVKFGPSRKIENSVIEVEEIGSGFMLIKREVFEKLVLKYPESKLNDPTLNSEPALKDYFYNFFEVGIIEGNYFSEDYGFCKKWKALSGKLYADLSLNVTTFGLEDFQGNILEISTIYARK